MANSPFCFWKSPNKIFQSKDLDYILVIETSFGLKLCIYAVTPSKEKEQEFYSNYSMYLKIINDWNDD